MRLFIEILSKNLGFKGVCTNVKLKVQVKCSFAYMKRKGHDTKISVEFQDFERYVQEGICT